MQNKDMTIAPTIIDTRGCMSEESGGRYVTSNGLTKLEHFAGLAMQAMISSKYVADFGNEINDSKYNHVSGLANNAVRYANALLDELEKESNNDK